MTRTSETSTGAHLVFDVGGKVDAAMGADFGNLGSAPRPDRKQPIRPTGPIDLLCPKRIISAVGRHAPRMTIMDGR